MSTDTNSKEIADKLIHWIRKYAATQINSHLADEQGSFPPHVLLELGNQGFFGIHITRQYGGLELTTFDMLRVIEQVAAIDLTLAVILIESIQGAHTLENYATESIKKKYLPLMATGRIFTAGAMTESDAGSNPRAMKSMVASDSKDGWLLKGSKRWVGMGASATLIAVYAHQFDANNQWLGMSGFLVPQGSIGLNIGHDAPTMGIRGFSKNTLTMDKISLSPEHLLGKVGEGMEIAQDNMMYIRLCLAAATVGAMKRCAQLMYRYAERRTIATGLLLDNPVTLVYLSEITTVIDAIDTFTYFISSSCDENPSLVPEEAFVISKILGSEYLGWVADRAVQLLGARGYEASCDVSKIFRDARVFRIFEGPTEALNMYIGSKALVNNPILENFISNTLNQEKLLDDIKRNIAKINTYCLSSKNTLFSKPFSVNYWAQTLVGGIITYGLLLACLEHSALENQSTNLQRATLWARNKYDTVVRNALTFSLGEEVTMQSFELKNHISYFVNTIGDIDQIREGKNISIDPLLRNHQEIELHKSIPHLEHEIFLKKQKNTIGYNENRLHVNTDERNDEKNTTYPNRCVHHLFEIKAIENPTSIAVVFNDETISYEALNAKANKVAHYLNKHGIEKNELVGIYFERSIEMIIGLLGVLKAGGAYLPLDYNYPEKSLQFMIEDSGSNIILSQKKLSYNFPFDLEKTIFIDDILENSDSGFEKNNGKQIALDNIGYVIYTSGSTGQPKGVMLPHNALTNLINWHNGKINGKRNVLQFTTLNFDMSFIEIFSALASGGMLTLISEEDRLDLSRFANIIEQYKVDQLILSVPFLKKLIDEKIEKKCFARLKEIIVAGEQVVVTPSMLSFFNQLSSCKFLNYYGPSETHVVTAYEFPQNTSDWPEYPPIGCAISNAKIVLLDDNKQPVPIGTAGEIYIGGICLAKGYMNRSELTREKFISNPLSDNPDDLLYRSGDCGKYLSDGNLVFLGRKDEQLKIRGYRIEPQEIEWHLMKYQAIKEAVVIAKTNSYTDKHLEAFIVIEGIINDDFINEIYSFLQDRLPPHMLPSVFNVIKSMPLTNSGKIDRIALEKYDSSMAYSINHAVAPTTDTEKEIIAIMEDIFKVNIGINNSFLSIGGNSLLSMQIISALRDKFKVDIPVYSLLSDPTIADTAKRIDLLRFAS